MKQRDWCFALPLGTRILRLAGQLLNNPKRVGAVPLPSLQLSHKTRRSDPQPLETNSLNTHNGANAR